MRYLRLGELLDLYERILAQSPGPMGIRDLGALDSALAQPLMTFDGGDLYPTLLEKAAALAYSIVKNHPFVDGNKRTAHAAMEVFLLLNESELVASVDEQERLMLALASGALGRAALVEWLGRHMLNFKH